MHEKGDELLEVLFLIDNSDYKPCFFRKDNATDPNFIKKLLALNRMQKEVGDNISIEGEFNKIIILRKKILAPSSGKIYLFNSQVHFIPIFPIICAHRITYGEHFFSAELPIGVIVDQNDPADKNEIFMWFRQQIGMKVPSWLFDHCRVCHDKSKQCNESIMLEEKVKYGLPSIECFRKD